MRVKVDEDLCIGSMSCQTICPEVFKVVGGVSKVQVDVVPPGCEESCREAVESCPVEAIRVVED